MTLVFGNNTPYHATPVHMATPLILVSTMCVEAAYDYYCIRCVNTRLQYQNRYHKQRSCRIGNKTAIKFNVETEN